MSGNICFIVYKTARAKYLYDCYSNSITRISNKVYQDLKDYENGLTSAKNPSIRKLQKYGLLMPYEICDIKHPETDFLPHILENCVQNIILQVTQRCNLRCSYCVYGDAYTSRCHTKKNMTFDVAKKAIDFLIMRSSECDSIILSFYGGEPLLEFELIKKCVEYTERAVTGKKVLFNITTNGTLLNKEIADFFVRKDFKVLISLDGDKPSHDANRKFANGEGSYDIIMKNITDFKKMYPEFVKSNVSFNMVVNPKTNLSCLKEQFSTDTVMSDINIMVNEVASENLLDSNVAQFDEKYRVKKRFEYAKMLASMINKIDTKHVSALVSGGRQYIDDLYDEISTHVSISDVLHPGGPCIPGKNRLLVSVDGNLYPCERVPELPYMSIGNIYEGFDDSRIRMFMNIGELTSEQCKKCWAIRHCQCCIAQFDCSDEDRMKHSKNNLCNQIKSAVMADLYEITVLLELGYRKQVQLVSD